MNYHLSMGGGQKGPFPTDQLLAQGLRPDTLVWADGMPAWARADQVPELRPLLAAAAPEFGAPQPPSFAQPPFAGSPYGQPGGFVPNPYQPGYPASSAPTDSNKIAAGICGLFLGAFGVHKFILGLNQAGTIMLLATLLTCGIAYPIMHIIGIVEGIIYLTKSDGEFYQLYIVQKKEWF